MTDRHGVPEPDIALAETLFERLAKATPAARGVTRPSFSEAEQIAHDMVRSVASDLELSVAVDGAGNLYCTLPGRIRGKPIIIGSHLDTVPEGGNYDGPAGVCAGLAIVSGFRKSGVVPPVDITVMAIRAEESVWFDASFLGSRAAFGQVASAELDSLLRKDSNRSLAEHMAALGLDVGTVREAKAYLRAEDILAFIEPHIEQGNVLIDAQKAVAVVTGIRGGRRFRNARCIGVDAHSGATPMAGRSDAVLATCLLVTEINQLTVREADAGTDIVFTVGIFTTDPAKHAFSKIAGSVEFTIDLRSASIETLDKMERAVKEAAQRIAKTQKVTFDLGPVTGSPPVLTDDALGRALLAASADAGIHAIKTASGAGHDAAVFARNGAPASMLFIRNTNGSHNPDEAMEIEDFAAAAKILMQFCRDPGQYGFRTTDAD